MHRDKQRIPVHMERLRRSRGPASPTSEDKTYDDVVRGSRPNTCMAADLPFSACDPRSVSPEVGRPGRRRSGG